MLHTFKVSCCTSLQDSTIILTRITHLRFRHVGIRSLLVVEIKIYGIRVSFNNIIFIRIFMKRENKSNFNTHRQRTEDLNFFFYFWESIPRICNAVLLIPQLPEPTLLQTKVCIRQMRRCYTAHINIQPKSTNRIALETSSKAVHKYNHSQEDMINTMQGAQNNIMQNTFCTNEINPALEEGTL